MIFDANGDLFIDVFYLSRTQDFVRLSQVNACYTVVLFKVLGKGV
jgi:hypothetical protein